MNKITTIAMMVLAVTAQIVGSAPTALAHTCEAYDGCDAGTCKDGENHRHVDKNYVKEDEMCESKEKDKDGGEKGCSFLGVDDWPELVCDLVDEHVATPPIATPGHDATGAETPEGPSPAGDASDVLEPFVATA